MQREPNDPVDHLQQTRDSYSSLGYPEYRWANNPEPPAFVRPAKPLAKSSVAVIASGGIYRHGQIAFTHKDDVSFRAIPTDTPADELRITHFAYDQTNARKDPNVVLPLGALRAMVAAGEIGSLADDALTFMGGIYSQRRVHDELIPALVESIRAMEPDLVLLVPV